MKGKGPKEERETIIRFSDASDEAEVWTASEGVYKRMRHAGWFPSHDNERSASFAVPKSQVRLPRPKSKAKSEAARKRIFERKMPPASE